MNHIKKIEINHFRSINECVIDGLSHINVFSGLNDVGKSNVIKALNLFFNDEVDRESTFDFTRDTNSWHSHYSFAGNNKKYVSIRLTFRRPVRRYEKTLREEFWVERYWDIYNQQQPRTTWGFDDIVKQWDDRPRALTEFMNRSHFFYVPAIRDREYFRYLILQFSKSITAKPNSDLADAGADLSHEISKQSASLRSSLRELTGIEFTLQLPDSLLTLLASSELYTEDDKALQLRGDGIQGLAVAGILAELTSMKKSDFYYWGFEEPENSLEYLKSTKLADEIEKTFSKKAQIFLSTHSPAFLAMENVRTSTYRVSRCLEREYQGHTEEVTQLEPVYIRGKQYQGRSISDELGFFDLVRKINQDYKTYEERRIEIDDIVSRYRELTTPYLIVEGSLDCKTLRHYWKRFRGDGMPFEIIVAKDARKVKDVTEKLIHKTTRKIFALFDNDAEGNAAIQLFNKVPFFKQDSTSLHRIYRGRDQVLAMTLPPPSGREEHAQNLNLTLEFYFPDSVLEEIDETLGCELFSRTIQVEKGETINERKKSKLDALISAGEITMIHRYVTEPGKTCLVRNLENLKDEDFAAFHSLMELILNHFALD